MNDVGNDRWRRSPTTPSAPAATAAPDQYQLAYFHLQQQALLQQSLQQQILLATATQQAMMSRAAQHQQFVQSQPPQFYPGNTSGGVAAFGAPAQAQAPVFVGGGVMSNVEEEDFSNNPLARSALARRKRQSLTLEPQPQVQPQAQFSQQHQQHQQHQHQHLNGGGNLNSNNASRRVSYGGLPSSPMFYTFPPQHQQQQQRSVSSGHHGHQSGGGQHHRRSSSGVPFVNEPRRSWSNSTGSGETPQLVLSKPGDPFPSPPLSDDDHGKVGPWLAGVHDAGTPAAPPRRASQAGNLVAALGRRTSNLTLEPASTASLSSFHHVQQQQQQQQQQSSAMPLSPFATTFSPLPSSPSPFASTFSHHSSHGVPPTPRTSTPPKGKPGMAVAVRQPRGPIAEEELASGNFASRLRRSAIARLNRSMLVN